MDNKLVLNVTMTKENSEGMVKKKKKIQEKLSHKSNCKLFCWYSS